MSSSPLRIVFFGTPDFAVPSLRALAREVDTLLGVVTQPDRPVGRGRRLQQPPIKQVATELGLAVLQPERLPEIRQQLESWAPDLAVVVAYGRIFRPWLLHLPRLGCLNVHASVLPELRGPAPIQWSVMRGYPSTGVSIMRLDEGVDTGPVCSSIRLEIGADEGADELSPRLAGLGAQALLEALGDLRLGSARFTQQDHDQASHAPMLSRADGLLDWSRPALELARVVRGARPWPGAWFEHPKGPMKVLKVTLAEGSLAAPGVVSGVEGGSPRVACAEGSLVLDRVQPAGRQAMAGEAALRGRYLTVGERVGP